VLRHRAQSDPGGGEIQGPDAVVFRPVVRGPMALLHIVDDGREDGETIRVRGDRLVIGRSEGDVRIPHDISMSSAHAAIERLPEGGWLLADLGSATGTFVRVTTARLKHGSIILVGATRLRFDVIDMTEAWLVELPLHGLGRRYECHGPSSSVGRAADGCQIVIDDPFVSPVHARVHRTQRGWRIENVGMNGLWVRLDAPVALSAPAQFQCGEQRFVFVPLT
jgi:pSer/pThr/pTyr-binding forkhead associated (FHA) protein